jgi:hypothetical protein
MTTLGYRRFAEAAITMTSGQLPISARSLSSQPAALAGFLVGRFEIDRHDAGIAEGQRQHG